MAEGENGVENIQSGRIVKPMQKYREFEEESVGHLGRDRLPCTTATTKSTTTGQGWGHSQPALVMSKLTTNVWNCSYHASDHDSDTEISKLITEQQTPPATSRGGDSGQFI